MKKVYVRVVVFRNNREREAEPGRNIMHDEWRKKDKSNDEWIDEVYIEKTKTLKQRYWGEMEKWAWWLHILICQIMTDIWTDEDENYEM